MEYARISKEKPETSQHVTGCWTRKHSGPLDRWCPKLSPDTLKTEFSLSLALGMDECHPTYYGLFGLGSGWHFPEDEPERRLRMHSS